MDVLYCCVWLLPLVAFSFGSEPPLKVFFEKDTSVVATEGDKVDLRCHLNRGALFILQNKVEIVHVNPRTQEETILTRAGDLVTGDPAYYSITIQQDRTDSTVDFMIKQVRQQDDGTFLCRVRSGTGDSSTVEASTEKEILVLRHLSSLKLQLGDLDPIEKTPATPVKINPGSYKVACLAEGSNPATDDVQLNLNGKTLITGRAVTKMDGPERKFKTEIHTNLNVEPRNDRQDLFCEARDPTGMVKRVSVELNVDTMTITTTRPTKNIITTTRRMKTTAVTTTRPRKSTDAGSGDGARLSPGSPLLCVMFTVVVAALWSLH